MSIEELCSKDTIVVQAETATTGGSFGVAESYADVATKNCLVQELSAKEVMDYAARGLKVSHQIFFSADPSIDETKRLRWQGARFLRVQGHYAEGPPGETQLWIVLADLITSRLES